MTNIPFKYRIKNQLRKLYYRGLPYWYCVKAHYSKGCLPDFLIVGVQKGGTTSLYNYLMQHPNIVEASRKEVHFFDKNIDRGLDWYKAHFCKAKKEKDKRSGVKVLTGEATPYYSCNPVIPQHIAENLPLIKIIFILRNPVQRSVSHYKHNVSRGIYKKNISMEEALMLEEKYLRAEIDHIREEGMCFSEFHSVYSLKERGKYIDQIKRYSKFFTNENMLVITAEELFESPNEVLNNVCNFLDLESIKFSTEKKHNQNPQDIRVADSCIDSLKLYFRPHNCELEHYLGRKMHW